MALNGDMIWLSLYLCLLHRKAETPSRMGIKSLELVRGRQGSLAVRGMLFYHKIRFRVRGM